MDQNFKDKFPQAKSFEDFRSEISIIELAIANGYVPEYRKGLRTPVFYNAEYQDRIIILDPRHPANQGYWNPEDDTDKGTLINFVKRRLGTIFPQNNTAGDIANVNSVLYHYLRLEPFVRSQFRQQVNYDALDQLETAEFLLDRYTLKPLGQTDFFTNRYVAAETLQLPEFAGSIFHVQHLDPGKSGRTYTNIAFPYYVATGNKIAGLEIRNNNYKGHAAGADRSNGVWHSQMPKKLERIILVESALDALSYQELKKQSNNLYVSYGGNLTLNQIQTIRQLKDRANPAANFQFVAASDNDKKGAYYDLLFIREMAAHLLPSQRLANPRSSIKLVFPCRSQQDPAAPEPERVAELAAVLAGKLRAYHQEINAETRTGKGPGDLKMDPEKNKINLHLEAGRLLVEIPNNFQALNAFNHKFIQAAGLEYDVRIDKALLNDYNEDLKLLKLINQDLKLLAELNKKDLRRDLKQPLNYLDLKFVMLQPGRYEYLGKVFHLVPSKEAGNPVLKFDPQAGKPDQKQATPPKKKK